MENLINPTDLLDQHSGDLYRVAVMAAETLGQVFVPGGARCALPVIQCTSHPRLGNLFSKVCTTLVCTAWTMVSCG